MNNPPDRLIRDVIILFTDAEWFSLFNTMQNLRPFK
jgi:hypothetical protein